MKDSFKYIVLGLGGLGSAAAYWLARREGREVLGIEQFELGHHRGESQDHSRIIRLTYHTIPYVRLAQQAYRAWTVIEQESGDRIVVKTGELN
ncbi:MAG: FAD-dependent oxidoreductase, partial [Parvibaculaceae bacterium]